MEIDTNGQLEQEEGLHQRDSSEEAFSSDEGDELDTPCALLESDDEGGSSEEDEDENYESEPEQEPEPEDDLEHLLTTLGNMQSDISFSDFTNRRNETPIELACHICVILLQIPIKHERYFL